MPPKTRTFADSNWRNRFAELLIWSGIAAAGLVGAGIPAGIGQAFSAAGGLRAIFRKRRNEDLEAVITQLADDLKDRWRDWSDIGSRDPGAVESAARSFADVLPHLTSLADRVVHERLNPDALAQRAVDMAAEVMPAVYADEDPTNTDARLARRFLSSLVKNAYNHLLAQPGFLDTLAPQLWRFLLNSIDELHDGQAETRNKIDRIHAAVEALSARTADADTRARLERQVALLTNRHRDTLEAVANLLGLLLQRHVPPSQWETALTEAEAKARELQQRIAANPSDGLSAEVRDLKRQAERATTVRDMERAEALLENIRDIRREARYRALSDEAAATADIAAARAARLDHRGASELYAEAASIPGLPREQQFRWRAYQAETLRDLGVDFGDTDALAEAVNLYRNTVLPLVAKERFPDDWTEARNGLAVALCALGNPIGGCRPNPGIHLDSSGGA